MVGLLTAITMFLSVGSIVLLLRAPFLLGRRMKSLKQAGYGFLGTILATMALGIAIPPDSDLEAQDTAAQMEQELSSTDMLADCSDDFQLCASEAEFKRFSLLFRVGVEQCKAATVAKADEYRVSGYKSATGIVSFGADVFHQIAYIPGTPWHDIMLEAGFVMKDEGLTVQVHGSARAPAGSVCLFDLDSQRVERISIRFD